MGPCSYTPDQDPGYKNRVLPAGEAILISKCRRVEVVAGWTGNITVGSSCPKYLPVKFPGRKEQELPTVMFPVHPATTSTLRHFDIRMASPAGRTLFLYPGS